MSQTPNTPNTPNTTKELKDMNISELQQAFNEAAKKGDMQRVSAIMKERDEKKKAENETLINENTSLEEVYKSLTSFEDNENAAWQNDIGTDEEKKQRRQKLKKFILEDIKTYKSNLDQQHKTLTDAKQTQINDLMKLLGEKDTEINDLTRKNEHLQERVLKLPNWQEIAPGAPGRRLNNLANQLKALSKADGYPTNALVLLFSQPEKNHIGLRRKLKKITMGYGKEMGKVKTRLAKRPLADVQKHLKAIKTKVTKILDNTNAKKEWTRDQATMIIQMINAIEADYKSYKTHDIGNSLDRKNATPWNKSNTHMSKWINENQTFNIKN